MAAGRGGRYGRRNIGNKVDDGGDESRGRDAIGALWARPVHAQKVFDKMPG